MNQWEKIAACAWDRKNNRYRRKCKARKRKPPTEDVKKSRARKMRANPTPSEARLLKALEESGIHFGFQVVIGSYIADFYIPSCRTVVEVDGSSHDDRAAYDKRRDRWFFNNGYGVLRFPNSQVWANVSSIIEKIRGIE